MASPQMTKEQAEKIEDLLEALNISADAYENEDEPGKWGVEIPASYGFTYINEFPRDAWTIFDDLEKMTRPESLGRFKLVDVIGFVTK